MCVGVSVDHFEQHISKIGKMQDYPVSPIREQVSEDLQPRQALAQAQPTEDKHYCTVQMTSTTTLTV